MGLVKAILVSVVLISAFAAYKANAEETRQVYNKTDLHTAIKVHATNTDKKTKTIRVAVTSLSNAQISIGIKKAFKGVVNIKVTPTDFGKKATFTQKGKWRKRVIFQFEGGGHVKWPATPKSN